jgi:hypothetical protein
MENLNIYLGMINSLLQSTLDAYKNGNHSYYNHVQSEINKISSKIGESEYGNLYSFPKLSYSSYTNSSDLMEAISVLRQMQGFLLNASGQKQEEVEKLKEDNKTCHNRIFDYEKKEQTYLEIIKKTRTASEYIADGKKLKLFFDNNLILIKEALDSYSVGAYTACTCVCRTILQDLIQKLCRENSISEGSLKAQIDKLIEKNIIRESHHSNLLEITKFFGNRASHPTTEVFDRDKANLILSSLFIINEELINSK